MAETLISPGVLARENDQSQVTSQPVQAGACIVGPTVLGRVGIPKLVTSYSEYLVNYGSTFASGSDEYTYFTSISAFNYFNNGGTSLIVDRIASGSWLPANTTTDPIRNDEDSGLLELSPFNFSGSIGNTGQGGTSAATGTGADGAGGYTAVASSVAAGATTTTFNVTRNTTKGRLKSGASTLLVTGFNVAAPTQLIDKPAPGYTGVALTQGGATSALADVIVAGGAITSVTVKDPLSSGGDGLGYTAGTVEIAAGLLGQGAFIPTAIDNVTNVGSITTTTPSNGAVVPTTGIAEGSGANQYLLTQGSAGQAPTGTGATFEVITQKNGKLFTSAAGNGATLTGLATSTANAFTDGTSLAFAVGLSNTGGTNAGSAQGGTVTVTVVGGIVTDVAIATASSENFAVGTVITLTPAQIASGGVNVDQATIADTLIITIVDTQLQLDVLSVKAEAGALGQDYESGNIITFGNASITNLASEVTFVIDTSSPTMLVNSTVATAAIVDGTLTAPVLNQATTEMLIEPISVTLNTQGSGANDTFAVGSVITMLGTAIGGATPAEDLVLTLTGADLIDDEAFTLETLSEGTIMNSGTSPIPVEGPNGTLTNGNAQNVRWEIQGTDVSQGTFSLIIRAGNDTATAKSILEIFPNVSLDPKASNYVAKVVGDMKQVLDKSDPLDPFVTTVGQYPNASRYVRVSNVAYKTPNYFLNDGTADPAYQNFLPDVASGSFALGTGRNSNKSGLIPANYPAGGDNYYDQIDGTNTQGLNSQAAQGTGDGGILSYDVAFNLLANKDDYQYNIITAPGLYHADYSAPLNLLIQNTANRGDAIAIVDLVNYSAGTISSAVSTAAPIDNSYAAAYWPWVQVSDPNTGQLVWTVPSSMIPGVYAFNDKTSEAWFAPAGINRGGLNTVVQAQRKLTQTNRDTLYTGKVNPIATFPGKGVVVFGQKTLQSTASALDRINVRRLLIALKSYIVQIADNLVFEQNTAATRNNFLSQVNPYMESVQQRQGLYAFKVVMDSSNNGPDVVDRNQMVGAIYVQPTKTAEFIYLDFNILPTGATFPS